MAVYPEQENLLAAVVEGACFQAGDLPNAPDDRRKAPRAEARVQGRFDWNK